MTQKEKYNQMKAWIMAQPVPEWFPKNTSTKWWRNHLLDHLDSVMEYLHPHADEHELEGDFYKSTNGCPICTFGPKGLLHDTLD